MSRIRPRGIRAGAAVLAGILTLFSATAASAQDACAGSIYCYEWGEVCQSGCIGGIGCCKAVCITVREP